MVESCNIYLLSLGECARVFVLIASYCAVFLVSIICIYYYFHTFIPSLSVSILSAFSFGLPFTLFPSRFSLTQTDHFAKPAFDWIIQCFQKSFENFLESFSRMFCFGSIQDTRRLLCSACCSVLCSVLCSACISAFKSGRHILFCVQYSFAL